MLFIDPFLFIINGVPQNQLSIHPSTGHKLEFGHGNHGGNHVINLLFGTIVLIVGSLWKHVFGHGAGHVLRFIQRLL
jgi:hypothetical protein